MRNILTIIIISLLIAGCSQRDAESYLKSAEENLKNSKFREAVLDYENFLKLEPQNQKAVEVLVHLASIYHTHSIKDISLKESFEKAAGYYRKVFENFPDSSQAPKSLFMAGFIYANELKKYHQAEVIYNLFLHKYPQHELAASAKEELNNLGLAPDEILKKKSSQNL